MRRQSGSALVVTLAVLAGLVALVGVLASQNGTTLKSETSRMALRRARLMADAGVQRGIAELEQQTKGPSTLNDSWATLGNSGASAFYIGTDSFRIQIVDLCSRVNLNTADHDTLAKLPFSPEQVDCLMDWRETSQNPRPSGAKDEFYNALKKPYNTKLQTLSSLDELLLVKNFTPSTLFSGGSGALANQLTVDSTSTDLDQNGNPKLNIGAATVDQLTAIGVPAQLANTLVQTEGSFSKWSDVLGVQGMDQASAKVILNNCQVGSNKTNAGLINLNTAPSAVLSAIPNLDPDVASSIIDRQSSGFKGIGDLVDIPGLTIANVATIADKFCVSSNAFAIRSLGSADGMQVGLEAVVTTTGDGNFTVSRVQPVASRNPSDFWGWPSSASDRTTVVGEW